MRGEVWRVNRRHTSSIVELAVKKCTIYTKMCPVQETIEEH